jgi:membrane protein
MIVKLLNFLKEDIWLTHAHELSSFKAFLIKYVKIFLLAGHGFTEDHCSLRASALTLFTLLSIVPVLAMLFGIAKGFGFQNLLQERLLEQIPQQEEMMLQLVEFAEKLLANTQGGVVAGIGVAVLFFTVIKVISNIEESFNHIWKISKGRPLGRKLSDYLSVMILAPLLLIASGSLSVFVKTQITSLVNAVALPTIGSSAVLYLLNYLSVLIILALFSFIYIFMPNTRVSYKSGLIAGIITGTIYQLVQWGYVSLQVGVSSYNAIYGSFAALPLFIIWLQVAWLIVLFGSEFTFFHQHYETYRNKDKFKELSFSLQKALALQITHLIVIHFAKAEKALSLADVAKQLIIPVSALQPILIKLVASKVLIEVKADDATMPVFQPAFDINLMTVASVIEALEWCGNNTLPDSKGLEQFMLINEEFRELLKNSAQNRLLKDI